MPKLFIPTRNRPESLSKVLEYLIRFYPETKVTIADGSDEDYKTQYQAMLEGMPRRLDLDYLAYPPETGFVDRCLDALGREAEGHMVFGADDDYPNMQLMREAEEFLNKNPDYSSAMGARIVLNMKNDEKIRSRLAVTRPLQAKQAWRRMKFYSKWSFATTYAVTSRRHLLDRLQRLKYLAPIGFYDFMVGLHDAACGKIKAYPDVGFFTTRTYTQNLIRNTDKLFFIRNSHEVLALQDIVKKDLDSEGLLPPEEVEKQSQIIIQNRIAELTGRDFRTLANFTQSKLYNDPVVQGQYKLHEELCDQDSATAKKYAEHLNFIHQAMQEVVESSSRIPGQFVTTLNGKAS